MCSRTALKAVFFLSIHISRCCLPVFCCLLIFLFFFHVSATLNTPSIKHGFTWINLKHFQVVFGCDTCIMNFIKPCDKEPLHVLARTDVFIVELCPAIVCTFACWGVGVNESKLWLDREASHTQYYHAHISAGPPSKRDLFLNTFEIMYYDGYYDETPT